MPSPAIVNPSLAFIGNLGWPEIGVILVVAVLIFGRRLPDVGRNVGKAIIEFKRGVKGITDEIEEESRKPDARESDRSVAAPELEAPKGTAYRGDAFHDDPPAGDVGRPDAPQAQPVRDPAPGEGHPRTS
ncbi:MAG: twin-arginine translocase TatA/TatE family subunit [Phycisphaerales bacterium JB060]